MLMCLKARTENASLAVDGKEFLVLRHLILKINQSLNKPRVEYAQFTLCIININIKILLHKQNEMMN